MHLLTKVGFFQGDLEYLANHQLASFERASTTTERSFSKRDGYGSALCYYRVSYRRDNPPLLIASVIGHDENETQQLMRSLERELPITLSPAPPTLVAEQRMTMMHYFRIYDVQPQ